MDGISQKSEKLLDRLTNIISDNMGQETAEMYFDFYKFDEPKGLIEGAEQLLTELLGPKIAKEKLLPIYKEL